MTTLLAGLLALRMQAQPQGLTSADPTLTTPSGIACDVLSEREVRDHRQHLVVCVEPTGNVFGIFLSRRGVPRCVVTGSIDARGCYALAVCGVPYARNC